MDCEQLSTKFKEWNLHLKRITSKEEEFIGSEPPFFDIVKPGCYVLDGERNIEPPIAALQKVWACLTANEREAFMVGLEAAKTPGARVFCEHDLF